jgi:SAM-dependent methyltransferase
LTEGVDWQIGIPLKAKRSAEIHKKNYAGVDIEMTDTFEEYAQEYDDWFVRHEVVYRAELAAVQSLIPETGQGLEIGVGTGRFAEPLGVKVGVEPAQAMANLARHRGIQVIQGYADALPIVTASFDFVLMVTVLCFLQNPLQALVEATRVLKPHGRLIIGLIDPESPLGRSYEANKKKSRFYRQARFHEVRQVLEWLDGLGYPNPRTCQTIFQDLPAIAGPEPVKEGHGEGGFVVISAQKSA